MKTPDFSKYEGHTPGPWKNTNAGWDVNGDAIYPLEGVKTVDIITGRLIADAPDLLAYAKEAAAEIERLQAFQKQVLSGCDGKCAIGECVCPKGGWEAENERLQKQIEGMNEQGWISTKERFPEDGQIVAFIIDSTNCQSKYYHDSICAGKFKWFDYGDGFKSPEFGTWGIGGLSASYWMPLPSKPETPTLLLKAIV